MVADSDWVVDIETARKECDGDPRNEQVMDRERVKNVLRSLGLRMSFKGPDEGEDSSEFIKNLVKSSEDECNDIESPSISCKSKGEKKEHNLHMPLVIGRTQSKDKHKNKNSKKPPRPRKGPSLSTNDLRLVKEVSELVMKKRARLERLKSLKKAKALASRPPSSTTSNISLFSMIITILFFIVIIIQVFGSSKTSTSTFHEKPEPSTQTTSGLDFS
uniref:uncharacterized protein LOC122609565 n=1 Tax=Erigeron canadensis TaxID=72917 RepID=UPI001CB9D386|nr:uncharacterized protein LOC122609565 [Erigeron canadensis]